MATARDVFVLTITAGPLDPDLEIESDNERQTITSGDQWSIPFVYKVGRPAETVFSYTLTKGTGGDPNAPATLTAAIDPLTPNLRIRDPGATQDRDVRADEPQDGNIRGTAPTVTIDTTYNGTVIIGT